MRPPLPHIVTKAAIDLCVPVSDLLGPSRYRTVSRARHEAMRRCVEAGYKHEAVGAYFNRDRSLVTYAANTDYAMIKRAKMRGYNAAKPI